MLWALLLGIFLGLLLALFRRHRRIGHERTGSLEGDLAAAQSDLQRERQRQGLLTSWLAELHDKKVTPTGKVDPAAVADSVVESALHVLRVERAVLLRWDAQAGELRGLSSAGLSPEQFSGLRFRRGDGILAKALWAGKITVVNNADTAPGAPLAQESFLTVPYLIAPISLHAQIAGLLAVSAPVDGPFDASATALAGLLAREAQLLLENLDLYQNRQRCYAETVDALAKAEDVNDGGSGHGERARRLTRALCQELHLPELLIQQIEQGAALHDIGKIGIGEQLWRKAGPLTSDEYERVKRHPEMGYQILRAVSFLRAVSAIVLHHHEWFNGQGYPEGLAGEEIPLGARIVALVDAWDAMTTDQPYRAAMPVNNAIAELRQQSGTQFDPKLVDLFLKHIEQWEKNFAAKPRAVSAGTR